MKDSGLPTNLSPHAAKLGMGLFIATEAMFFAGLISAYLVFRVGAADWPLAGQPILPAVATAFNTLILLVSALWMHLAVRAIRAGKHKSSAYFLCATAVFGLFFLILQGREWIRMVQFGLTLTSSVYGGLFYTIIGVHGLHVLGGTAALLYVVKLSVEKRFTAENHLGVELCRMYWNFVVGVWPILYALVYLT